MTQYTRYATMGIPEVVNAIIDKWDAPKTEKRVTFENGYSVGVISLRMRTFGRAARQGKLHCVSCGCKAKFFAAETFTRSKDQSVKHANLYGVNDNGDEVLFTHDHIVARSLGGADDLSNSQVMCSPCNNKKSKLEIKILEDNRKKKNVDTQASICV